MGEPDQTRTWAFLSLLAGGVLIALSGLVWAYVVGSAGWLIAMPMSRMMGGDEPSVWGLGAAWWMSGVGLVTGGLVLVAAHHVRHMRNAASWSIVSIVAGSASLLAMGGYVAGALSAIVGGVLGLVGTDDQALGTGDT